MTFNEYIGMEPAPADEDCIAARIRIEAHHTNPTGVVNGGVLLSLADNLATGMANRAYQEKTGESAFMVGVALHAVMLSNQQGGEIRAESRVVRAGRRVTVIRTTVTGDDGATLAEITSTHVPVKPHASDVAG